MVYIGLCRSIVLIDGLDHQGVPRAAEKDSDSIINTGKLYRVKSINQQLDIKYEPVCASWLTDKKSQKSKGAQIGKQKIEETPTIAALKHLKSSLRNPKNDEKP